jgi:hypothetical protein
MLLVQLCLWWQRVGFKEATWVCIEAFCNGFVSYSICCCIALFLSFDLQNAVVSTGIGTLKIQDKDIPTIICMRVVCWCGWISSFVSCMNSTLMLWSWKGEGWNYCSRPQHPQAEDVKLIQDGWWGWLCHSAHVAMIQFSTCTARPPKMEAVTLFTSALNCKPPHGSA